MSLTISYCSFCKHYRGKNDNYDMICEAYPEGIPNEKLESIIPKLVNCDNRYNFDVKDNFKYLVEQ